MSVELQRRRFTVDEYYAMADAGILSEDDRVELIDGEIIQMAAIGSQHAACVGRLNRTLVEQAASEAVVWPQNPVRLSQLSEAQPDLAVLRPRDDFYSERWIVDVDHEVVEVYAGPEAGHVRIHETDRRGDVLRPRTLPSVAVPVEQVLG